VTDVLVLASNYLPLRRCSWREAAKLLCNGRVDIVESYEDREIHSPSITMKMPAVVRFVRPSKFRQVNFNVEFNKPNLYVRDGGCCQFCGKQLTLKESTIDHVYPKCHGGRRLWDNCVLACMKCNSTKSNKPVQPKTKPRKPSLSEYIRGLVTIKPIPDQWRQYLP